MKGKVETQLRLQCVRCLKEFTYPLGSTFELTLHPLKGSALEEETLNWAKTTWNRVSLREEKSTSPKLHANRSF